jgi:DNA-binding response OmpR family regulator
MRLLLIEDSPRLSELVSAGLAAEGFSVDAFATSADATAVLKTTQYDLILLDLGLPDGDGITLLDAWKRRASMTAPVLVITARDGLDDRVTGLDAGADDYLVKPFAMKELVARCRALLRRPGACLGTVLVAGNIRLDVRSHAIAVAGRTIPMPLREQGLLEVLMRHENQVVVKSAIEEALYAFSSDVSPNALEATVSRLRKRLAAAGADVRVHTSHGIGYGLLPEIAPEIRT